ncbi:MAG: 3-hydroxyacyl-CoA dehydrogenase NAD-binding domain-containing protein [Novosphingobium sp.]
MSAVEYSIDGEVAILTVQYPPVNALSFATRSGLAAALDKAEADSAVKAVIILGSGSTFIAGADITEFGTENATKEPRLQTVQQRLEAFPKLTVAAIHGTALGGGLELALTCAARVAVPSAKLGLPEVNLGLLPGAGGTQRLPRLTGAAIALDLITSGKPISAARALELGVVDAVVDELLDGALTFTREALAAKRDFTPVGMRQDKVAGTDPKLFADFKAKVNAKARGKIAPAAIVDCIEAACTLPIGEGLVYEQQRFQELYAHPQHAALKHAFFAEREARKIPDVQNDMKPLPIRKVAVIGSGTMGGGIAMVFANAGMEVKLVDIDQGALDRGLSVVRANYEISVGRGSMAQSKADAAVAKISGTTSYDDLGDIDLVIEAVFEKMALKKVIFAQLDKVCPPHCILGTNTSSLDIDEIASATSRPDKVIGTHFFSPANVMKLQENVRGKASSAETIATVMALGKTIGKVVILAGNCDGFVGNRMLQYYTGEAEFMLEQGATPEQIDRVAMAFGMPMGPISMRDMSGLDVGVLIRKERAGSLPEGERMSPILERLVEAGRLGMKSGAGFYRYEGRDKFPDPEAIRIIESVSAEYGITRREFSDEEVRDRLFMPLVNEGAKELEDGTAIRASDIDTCWINGYGFPAHLGGPMHWGAQIGFDKVYAMALELGKRNGPRWMPGKLLERLANAGPRNGKWSWDG